MEKKEENKKQANERKEEGMKQKLRRTCLMMIAHGPSLPCLLTGGM